VEGSGRGRSGGWGLEIPPSPSPKTSLAPPKVDQVNNVFKITIRMNYFKLSSKW